MLDSLKRSSFGAAHGRSIRRWPTYEAYRRNQYPGYLSETRWRTCYGRAYYLGARVRWLFFFATIFATRHLSETQWRACYGPTYNLCERVRWLLFLATRHHLLPSPRVYPFHACDSLQALIRPWAKASTSANGFNQIYLLTSQIARTHMADLYANELTAWTVFKEFFRDAAPSPERDFILNAGLTFVLIEERENIAQEA